MAFGGKLNQSTQDVSDTECWKSVIQTSGMVIGTTDILYVQLTLFCVYFESHVPLNLLNRMQCHALTRPFFWISKWWLYSLAASCGEWEERAAWGRLLLWSCYRPRCVQSAPQCVETIVQVGHYTCTTEVPRKYTWYWKTCDAQCILTQMLIACWKSSFSTCNCKSSNVVWCTCRQAY